MKFQREMEETLLMLARHESVKRVQVVGSARVSPDPNDIDFLVLVDGQSFGMEARWEFGPDWSQCGEYDTDADKWGAVRKGNVNLILTVDPDWYDRFARADELCVALKLTNKDDRIVTHRVVRDGKDAATANTYRTNPNPFA